ncbi:hypothetical protein O181_120628 [Austropuccinia psidii MF-1]|uniref:Uncharacterized protein n=1 Tax=Austropuccinia psidii MF-1 TaxID=1389203 RepID=A0A9Q3KGD1_9BASI|nr:hypothetical protein [Austropuccinia psidii MF-1]
MEMVHTRNESKYSVQPDGCAKGRGKTKSRSVKSSSRKTHMEGARVAPHFPRSVTMNFDVNSKSGLIHDNISRDEPVSSGRNRNLSMPIQKLVQSSQRRGVGSMPKPLAGGHELLLTHQELSTSGEDHRTLRRLEPIVLQRQSKKDKELVEEPKSFIHRPEEGVGNDSSFGDRRPSGVYQLQTSSISVQGQAKRTSEEAERSQEPSRQGQRKSQLAQTLPTRVQDSQIGAFSSGQCLQYGQNSYGIHIQRAGKDEQDFSTQIIDEVHFVKSSIDVELRKFDAKLNKIILDMSELKKNDKKYTEWYQLTNVRLDSITNTCYRIESKCQVQNAEMEDLSILNINDQLRIWKDHEPHMPRHSTPLTEEKRSVKGSLTPFLGENIFSAKDIPKLEEWPTFSSEGEYNHIEFIRTIDMLQEDFHIPHEIIVSKLHSLFIRTAKKWYCKMRQDHGKHDWSW